MKTKYKKPKKGHKPFDLFAIKPVGPLQQRATNWKSEALARADESAVMLMIRSSDNYRNSGAMVAPILITQKEVQACTDMLRRQDGHPLRSLYCGIIRAWLQLHS